MDFKDYYKILGVPKTATAKEIKAAYRKLARKHHPDLNQGNPKEEARFKEVNEAHEVLSDPEKRKRYDELGANWNTPQGQAGSAGQPWGRGGPGNVRVEYDFGGGGGDFSDFFRTFFGGGFGGGGFRGGGGPGMGADFAEGEPMGGPFGRRPPDLEQDVELTLEEVMRGTTRTLQVEGGPRVEVRIPAGVRDGQRVRVAGEGARAGKARGDVYLRVRTRPHPTFERKGDDLAVPVRIPITTAALGGQAEVPTLDGTLEIKIPAGTSSGRTFRLRGQGLPKLESGGGRGDLLATVVPDVPSKLTAAQKDLFEKLRETGA
jgi:curved DNA-binding protein